MSRPDIVANMARGWNRAPAGEIIGTPRNGVSAALWTHDKNNVQEVWADRSEAYNIISVFRSSITYDMFIDDVLSFSRKAPSGGVQIVRASERPRAVLSGKWAVLHLYLPTSLILALASEEGSGIDGSSIELIDPACAPDLFIEQIATEVLSEMRDGAPLSRLRIDALGQELSIRLLRFHSNLRGTRALARPAQLQGGLAPWQVKRVCEAMVAAMDMGEEESSLAELALLVGMSANHLCRSFARSTGQPPHRWMTERRIERAKALMANPQLSLTEIALAVGYASQNTLGRAFARSMGVAPSEWRRTRQR